MQPVLTEMSSGESITYPALREGRPAEEAFVGSNRQPEWTTARRFPTTRVYVLAPWQVEVEQWWKGKFPRSGGAENLFQSEIEIGLPGRFQIDVYENITADERRRVRHAGNQFEIRFALAEWGKIPLNPTIYAEWKLNDKAADAYEVKVLLAEEIAPRWHWASNLFYEQVIGDERDTEMGFSQALSYTVVDGKISAGIEMQYERRTVAGARGDAENEFLIGPSLQVRPTPRMHINFVPLFGVTNDSPRIEAFIVFGIDFGRGEADHGAPVSARAR